MYGPVAVPPPPPPPHPRRGTALALRLLFASFPLWSLGLLSWVPSLRFAIMRRRVRDWAVFGLFVLLTAVYVVLLSTVPESGEGESGIPQALAGLYAVLLILGTPVYAVVVDRFPPAPRPWAPYAQPYPQLYSQPYPQPYMEPYIPPYAEPVGWVSEVIESPETGPAAPLPGPAGPMAPFPPPSPRPEPPPSPPAPPGPDPATSTRIRQVRSELDELSERLRKRDHT